MERHSVKAQTECRQGFLLVLDKYIFVAKAEFLQRGIQNSQKLRWRKAMVGITGNKKLKADGFLAALGSAAVDKVLANQCHLGEVGVGWYKIARRINNAELVGRLNGLDKLGICHIAILR